MKTICNNCLDEFEAESGSIQTVKIDGMEIQFFPCPSCGRKYVIFAADDEMKKMVVARSLLQKRIKAAHVGKFRQSTVHQLINEQTRLIREQKKLWAELKPRAEKLINEDRKETEND